MLTKSSTTVAAALAVIAIGAAPAQAMPTDYRGEHAASLSQTTGVTASDARGEHAASLSQPSGAVANDQRTADAREPFVPVVIDVGAPESGGFDWVAAIAGVAGGLAFAILAGIGVTGSRRRPARPSIG
jgi:hypothetical protein